MNYILTTSRNYNGFFQNVCVKMRGARGQQFPAMRTWALILTQFDFTSENFPNYTGDSIVGTEYKSMNFVTHKSEINLLPSEHTVLADVCAVVKWKEERSVDGDAPRSTIIKVFDVGYNDVVSAIKSEYTRVTAKNYDDNRLCIVSLNINLKIV